MALHEEPSAGAPLPPIVLIVEDDGDTRELYETVFKLEGFWVADAVDAESAVEQATELQPDVIITDVGLPGGCDGVRLANRLHALARTADVPIIAVTGRNRSEIASEQFSAILQKPVLPNELVAAARQVLSASAALRQRSVRARERVPGLIEKSERLRTRSHRLLDEIRSKTFDGPDSSDA
jgi:DNA-binding response OmpR family regulator